MPRIMRGESVRNFELRLRRPDQGWERIVSYSGAMVETASGERLVFLSVYDLTERERAEEALQKAHDELGCGFRRERRASGVSDLKRFLQAKRSFACLPRPCLKSSGLPEPMAGTSISTNSGWTTRDSPLKKATAMAGTNRSTPTTRNAPGMPGRMR